MSKESLLFGLRGPGLGNTAEDIDWSLAGLRVAQRDGLVVFVIEYLDDPDQIVTARRRLSELGFTPFFANRLLNRVPRTP